MHYDYIHCMPNNDFYDVAIRQIAFDWEINMNVVLIQEPDSDVSYFSDMINHLFILLF